MVAVNYFVAYWVMAGLYLLFMMVTTLIMIYGTIRTSPGKKAKEKTDAPTRTTTEAKMKPASTAVYHSLLPTSASRKNRKSGL